MKPSPARHSALDERDRRVHEAVHALLAEQGMRLSMDAVAARAGCSKQTLYSRYGNKQNLLRQVMQEHVEETGTHLQVDDRPPREALLAFALGHLQKLECPDVIRSCRLIDAQAHRFPEQARQIYQDGAQSLQQRLADWMQAAIDRGQLRRDNPHFLAELLLSMIVGLDFERQRFHVPHRTIPEDRRRWAEFAVDSFLRAFSADTFPHSNL